MSYRHISDALRIEDLSARNDLIPLLARWHFRQWGHLTGATTESCYKQLLSGSKCPDGLRLTLIALRRDRLLGSVTLVECDMAIRTQLKPWVAQLYVDPAERGRGIGSELVTAAEEQSRSLGYERLYLYTSGTLPFFYDSLGWKRRETVYYKDRKRMIMEKDLATKNIVPARQQDRQKDLP